MRAVRDPTLELRSVIAALQQTLDRAHERIRELEGIAALANARAASAVEYADSARLEIEAQATQPVRDVSP